MNEYDIAIIGGGINGVGIAVDAAARGLKVLLCEKRDLASGTSSASTKLIHGGLRYLEQGEFTLVRKALQEREILYRKAPHIIRPMQFVVPYQPGARSKWLIRLGLFLYDHLARHPNFPASKMINLSTSDYGKGLQQTDNTGFVYSDGWTDDARLVVLNAMAAQQEGASILTQTEFVGAKRSQEDWLINLRSSMGQEKQIRSRCLINAAGPWVDDILMNKLKLTQEAKLHLVKGSHMVLPKIYEGDHAFLLQHGDKRVIFVIPYFGNTTLVGTTEHSYSDSLDDVSMSNAEENYLLTILNFYFQSHYRSEDILYRYAGCRPLFEVDEEDVSAMSRDYQFELNQDQSLAPLLTIYGGKLTTYRLLAQQAVDQLAPFFSDLSASNTEITYLPGGCELNAYQTFEQEFKQSYAWLPSDLQQRYLQSYGLLVQQFLQDKKSLDQLGLHFGHGLYQAEVDYLVAKEWAKNSNDILFRRSKLGMFFSEEEKRKLDSYIVNA